MASTLPSTYRIWQYTQALPGGIEQNMKLNTVPLPKPKAKQHLIRVLAAALNPVDYKPAETPYMGSLVISKPATPAADLAGEIVIPASGSNLKAGDLVFGTTGLSPFAGGALAEYVLADTKLIVPIPKGVSVQQAASLPIAAVTAYQSVAQFIKKGSKVFVNGGSGGVGLSVVQIAKALGAHVTTSCSGRNVELVKSMGADVVVDYTKGDVVEQLVGLDYKVDHIVDCVGGYYDLYWKCDRFTLPGTKFIEIAGSPTLTDMMFVTKAMTLPSFLGGQKRKLNMMIAKLTAEDLEKLANMVKEGTLKVQIDSTWPFDQATDAYRKLKTHRAVGKIIVDVGRSG